MHTHARTLGSAASEAATAAKHAESAAAAAKKAADEAAVAAKLAEEKAAAATAKLGYPPGAQGLATFYHATLPLPVPLPLPLPVGRGCLGACLSWGLLMYL